MKLLDKENILYLDNHIIVVEKEANLLTQPNDGEDISLEDMVKSWLKLECKKPGNVFLHAIHRLDKEVSGLVLFARTSKALSRLNEEMRKQKIERYYLAKVEGVIFPKNGTLSHYLKHESYRASVVSRQHSGAKEAILEYEILDHSGDISTLKIKLLTGRYHQIRAQLAAIGHPIIGDKKYGSNKDNSRILLHHYVIKFIHPITKEFLEIKSKCWGVATLSA